MLYNLDMRCPPALMHLLEGVWQANGKGRDMSSALPAPRLAAVEAALQEGEDRVNARVPPRECHMPQIPYSWLLIPRLATPEHRGPAEGSS